jgi:hypothetical protein
MAFDPIRRRIVLFGGDSEGRLNDTWEWDGDEWVQQGDSGPSGRIHPAMAYDTGRSRLVLFGGAAEDVGLGDTWEWDGTAWTEESDFGADPCAGAAMVFKGSRSALFGGAASIAAMGPQPFGRSWEWNGTHWTARQDMGPGGRVFHAMAFDESRSRVVLFGGSTVAAGNGGAAGLRGDTWEQFEEGAPTGPGGVVPGVASVEVNPNSAPAGSVVNVLVTLTGPAEAESVVALLLADVEVATIGIAPGESSGGIEIQLPPDLPTGTVILTASLAGSEAATTLQIVPVTGTGDIASVTAEPNPVTAGETLVITVFLAGPLPEDVNVDLIAEEGEPFANLTIPAGETSGQLSLPIQPGSGPIQITLTARSGASEASVEVTIQ